MNASIKLLRIIVVTSALFSAVVHAQSPDLNSERKLIKLILNAKSFEVFLYSPEKPFVLKSGKVSPVFINMCNISSGEGISLLGDIYAEALVNNKMKFDIVYGSAYKGILSSVTIVRSLYE